MWRRSVARAMEPTTKLWTIEVTVSAAYGLRGKDPSDVPTFVRVMLDGSTRTTSQQFGNHPQWNESFQFVRQEIDGAFLSFSVFQVIDNRVDFYGQVNFDLNSSIITKPWHRWREIIRHDTQTADPDGLCGLHVVVACKKLNFDVIPFQNFTLHDGLLQTSYRTIGETRHMYNVLHSNLFMIRPGRSKFRSIIVTVVDHRIFDVALLMLIIANSIFLAVDVSITIPTRVGAALEVAFTIMFTVEIVLKVLAHGLLLHEYSYLRSPFNVLDFFIVVVSLFSLFFPSNSWTGARLIRVMRPLRSVNKVPGLKRVISTVMRAMPMMGNALMLLIFFMYIFTVVGVDIWNGEMHSRCYYSDPNSAQWVLVQNDTDNLCGARKCNAAENGVNLPQQCAINTTAFQHPITNYDNLLTGFLFTFHIISLDDWVTSLRYLQQLSGYSAFFFALSLTVLGSYFCINMFLAVLTYAFSDKEEAKESDRGKGQKKVSQYYINPNLTPAAMLAKTIHGSWLVWEAASLPYYEQPYFKPGTVLLNVSGIDAFGDRMEQLRKVQDMLQEAHEMEAVKKAVKTVGKSSSRQPLWISRMMYRFVNHASFSSLMLAVTLFNVLVLSSDHYPIPQPWTDFITMSNFVCSIIFVVEWILKMIAFGVPGYFRDLLRVFDFILVAVSIREIVDPSGGSLLVFRIFRLARVLRVLRRFPTLYSLLLSIVQAMGASCYLLMVTALLVAVYAILGVQLFKGTTKDSRFVFDSIWQACVTVFTVMSGENWGDIMLATMGKKYYFFIYFVSCFCIGNFIFLNLFTSILIDTFANQSVQISSPMRKASNNSSSTSSSNTNNVVIPSFSNSESGQSDEQLRHDGGYKRSQSFMQSSLVRSHSILGPQSSLTRSQSLLMGRTQSTVSAMNPLSPSSVRLGQQTNVYVPWSSTRKHRNVKQYLHVLKHSTAFDRPVRSKPFSDNDGQSFQETGRLEGEALNIFKERSRIRLLIARVVLNRSFERVAAMLTVLNCVSLALQGPNTSPSSARVLNQLDVVLTVVFCAEALLKIVALGLYFTPRAYLKSNWNKLDFIVVLVIVAANFVESVQVFRCLRVFRLIVRIDELQIVLLALIHAIPSLAHISVVSAMIFFVFGVLGVILYKGTFGNCNDSGLMPDACKGVFFGVVGQDVNGVDIFGIIPRVWGNADFTFDNIGEAVLTLFMIALGDGWSTIMFYCMDSVAPGLPSATDNSPASCLYVIVFLVVGNFFFVSVFTGLLSDGLLMQKMDLEGGTLLTEGQRTWLSVQKILHRVKLDIACPIPSQKYRFICYKIINYKGFELIMQIIIICNSLILGINHYGMSDTLRGAIETINTIFVAAFTIEAIMKIVGTDMYYYFRQNWNKLDFAILIVCYVGLIMNVGTAVIRMLRVLRVLRLIRFAKGMQRLVITLMYALPSLLNILILMFLIMFVFAIVGMNIFGRIARTGVLSEFLNFEHWHTAMNTLYQQMTTENWTSVMLACASHLPDCDPAVQDCGRAWISRTYFIIYVMIGTFVLLNLVVAVILENFNEATAIGRNQESLVCFEQFRELWQRADPEGKRYIPAAILAKLLPLLPPPLWYQCLDRTQLVKALIELQVPVTDKGTVWYGHVIHALCLRVFGIDLPPSHITHLTGLEPEVTKTTYTLQHFLAVRRIEEWARRWKRSRGEKRLQRENDILQAEMNWLRKEMLHLSRSARLSSQREDGLVGSSPVVVSYDTHPPMPLLMSITDSPSFPEPVANVLFKDIVQLDQAVEKMWSETPKLLLQEGRPQSNMVKHSSVV